MRSGATTSMLASSAAACSVRPSLNSVRMTPSSVSISRAVRRRGARGASRLCTTATATAPVASTATTTRLYHAVSRARIDHFMRVGRAIRRRPTACSLRRVASRSATRGRGRRSCGAAAARRRRWHSTSPRRTCPRRARRSTPRPTTSSAWSARCSSSAYSRAVRISGSPRRDARRARVSSSQRTDANDRRRERTLAAADDRAQPRQQLAEVERLGQVVVGAAVEARDARVDRVARRQHQHRHRRAFAPDLPADGQTILQRQHDVEDDRVVVGDRRLVDGAARRRRRRRPRRPPREGPWPASAPRAAHLRPAGFALASC